MHRRTAKASLIMAAAAITVTSAGLASTLPAAASPPATRAPAITTVIDTNFAGYLTGGSWRFRYVSADVTMARCGPPPTRTPWPASR